MKTAVAILFLGLFASNISGQVTGAPVRGNVPDPGGAPNLGGAPKPGDPPPSQNGVLSFSLTPCAATSMWPNDRPVGYKEWIGPSFGITVSCRYRLPASFLFIGTDFGYSPAGVPYSWIMSILQAGLSAGFQSDPRYALGWRLFGSAGYSFNSIQGPSKDLASLLVPSKSSVAMGGTPYLGAGCELSWAVIPSLSLAAGVRFRYLVDLYADVGATLGVSINLPVGGPRAERPIGQRAAPLKDAPYPRVPTRHRGTVIESVAQSFPKEESGMLLLSNEISSLVEMSLNRSLDRNLQLAIGFHQALRVLDIACLPSPPESGGSARPVKSPRQTLRDGSGNSCDLAVLYCSLLMPLGVETALIHTPRGFFIAVALAASEEDMRKAPGVSNDLLFREGRAWVPIEVSERRGSFLEAWQAGLAEWRGARKQSRFCPVPASGSPGESTAAAGNGDGVLVPDQCQVIEGFQKDVALVAARMKDVAAREDEK